MKTRSDPQAGRPLLRAAFRSAPAPRSKRACLRLRRVEQETKQLPRSGWLQTLGDQVSHLGFSSVSGSSPAQLRLSRERLEMATPYKSRFPL